MSTLTAQPADATAYGDRAYRYRWISAGQLDTLAQPLSKNGYGQYLLRILKEA